VLHKTVTGPFGRTQINNKLLKTSQTNKVVAIVFLTITIGHGGVFQFCISGVKNPLRARGFLFQAFQQNGFL